MDSREELNEQIKDFVTSGITKDARFMRALLIATIFNQVRPKSYAIQHIQLSKKYEQYIVSENKPTNLWKNQELNYALQALIFEWFKTKHNNILYSYVDDGSYAVFTLTRKIKIGDH